MPVQGSTGAGGLGGELPSELGSGIDQQSGIDTDGAYYFGIVAR